MNSHNFDHLTRSLAIAPTRRGALGGLIAGIGSVLAGTRSSGRVASQKKNKKRNKPKKNEFGCLNVGKKCNGKNSKCCSGVCKGKGAKKGRKDRSECKAHDVGTCQASDDSCLAEEAPCGTEPSTFCFRTTGNASFCGALLKGDCIGCAKDTDCEPTFGPGAACVICSGCLAFGNTACFPPGA